MPVTYLPFLVPVLVVAAVRSVLCLSLSDPGWGTIAVALASFTVAYGFMVLAVGRAIVGGSL